MNEKLHFTWLLGLKAEITESIHYETANVNRNKSVRRAARARKALAFHCFGVSYHAELAQHLLIGCG